MSCRRHMFVAAFTFLIVESLAYAADPPAAAFRDDLARGTLDGWRARDGQWAVRDGRAAVGPGFALLLRAGGAAKDVSVAADVAYSHTGPHAAAGLAVRMSEDLSGYVVCLREVERGVDPKWGPWERPLVQLYRLDKGAWRLLQESKIMGARDGVARRVRVVCRGPNLWVFDQDMATPVLTEFDDVYDRPGAVGLLKDHLGSATFANVEAAPAEADPAPAASRVDWSWVRGAVYVRSDAVNAVQMWHEYWEQTDRLDRELALASDYGFNMIQAYLHYAVWERHGAEYLRRIDDFLTRAERHGLKVNLILWDDCGHVEPGLTFAEPVRGRHNSQMMPNPSHRVRDGAAAGLAAMEAKYRAYVEGIVGRFKDDRRLAFWQIYNECMGPKERYRDGTADANLNQLLAWTRAWAKGTGTRTPLTATGGGFYGPKYSDFYTYHSYAAGPGGALPGADGGPEHLCTETLNRPNAGVADCLAKLAGPDKRNGLVVWELMIGRDNCRFPWGHPDGPAEPAVPFHGVVYPDGHPWDVAEVRALLGEAAFERLRARSFAVEYFGDAGFGERRKTSITPAIDFDLGDEPGTGSPDASAGIGKDHFSIRWTGRLTPVVTGRYTLEAEADGAMRVWVDGAPVIEKRPGGKASGEVVLTAGQGRAIKVEYAHEAGAARARLRWRGPRFEVRPLRLDGR